MNKAGIDKVREALGAGSSPLCPAYFAVADPSQYYDLKVISAKLKYYHDRWVVRYNKWRAKNGNPPYIEVEGEVGVI